MEAGEKSNDIAGIAGYFKTVRCQTPGSYFISAGNEPQGSNLLMPAAGDLTQLSGQMINCMLTERYY